MTDAQAECLLDGVFARGVSPRDRAVLEEKVVPAAAEAGKACL